MGTTTTTIPSAATQPFLAPFIGIFPQRPGGFAAAILVAMLAYALFVYFIVRIVNLVDDSS